MVYQGESFLSLLLYQLIVNNMSNISRIIANTFNRDFFLGYGYSLNTEEKLKDQINTFNNTYPNAISDFLENLRKSFPEVQVEDWTHFFSQDRCARFLVQFDEQRRYVCQLSIYNYFSVYHCPYNFANDRYTYGKKQFINQFELQVCDRMYECAAAITNETPIWLEREKLNEIVFDFSTPGFIHDYVIKVADVLFTTHYL